MCALGRYISERPSDDPTLVWQQISSNYPINANMIFFLYYAMGPIVSCAWSMMLPPPCFTVGAPFLLCAQRLPKFIHMFQRVLLPSQSFSQKSSWSLVLWQWPSQRSGESLIIFLSKVFEILHLRPHPGLFLTEWVTLCFAMMQRCSGLLKMAV